MTAYDSEPLIKTTTWGLFNAVTNYIDHHANSKNDDYIMLGQGARIKQQAYRKLHKLTYA